MTTRWPTPEERELEKKKLQLAELEKQLVERELELETLRGGLLAFEKKYQAATQERYGQLDELRFRIAELQAQQQPEQPAAQVAVKVAEVRRRASARRSPPKAAPNPQSSSKKPPPPEFNPTEVLKKLYRQVAKTIHPDLADDDSERDARHRFMTRANEAYEANDEKRLAEVLKEWHCSPESVRGEGAGAELVRAIRKIARCEERLVVIDMELNRLQTDGIFGIKMLAEEADKLERDFLSEMTQRLDAEIEGAKAMLLRLGGKLPELPAPQNAADAPAAE